MTRDQCPPENTPLVSSIRDLAEDKTLIDEWKSKAAASFPGREASFDDKLKWYHSSSESVYDDFMSGAPEPHEFLPAVLLDACDDSVELQLIIKRSHVKKLNEIGAEEKAIFMASAERARGEPLRQRVLNKARSTEKGLAAYVEWLADGENGATSCEMRPKTAPKPATLLHPDAASAMQPYDEVVVASKKFDKKDCWKRAIKTLMRNTGLYGTVEAPRTTSDWSVFAHNIGAGMDKVVGENVFYVNKHGTCCVALELVDLDTAQRKSKEPASAAFRSECSRLLVAHPDKHCVSIGADEKDKDDDVAGKPTEWPDEDSSSSEDESGDDMSRPPVQAIWLPKFYSQERERVFAHIHDGAGETTDVKQRLQKGTTDTGNVRFAIVESEFKWTNQRFRGDADKKRYFCALLALTQAMVYDDHWMYDNECWDEVGDLCKKMASKWRELLKMDETALGLGLAGNPKHTPQMSKAALVRLLNWLKGQIEAHPDTDYKFSLATRKRRADAGMSKADWDAKKASSGPAPKKAKKAKK